MEIIFSFLEYTKISIENNFFIPFILFFSFLLLYSSFLIPVNTIFFVASGYFFGLYVGFFLSICALVLGSLIFFSFLNPLIKKIFPKIIIKYSKNIDKYISNSSIEYLIIFRIIPGPPLFFQNLILSFLNISKINFILSSFLGFTPIVLILVFVGNKLNDIDNLKNFSIKDIFSFQILFFIPILIIFLLLRIYFKKK